MEPDRNTKHSQTILRDFPERVCITLDALTDHVGLPRATVSGAVGRLVTTGLVQRRKLGCYQLTTLGVRAKRAGTNVPAQAPSEPSPIPDDDFNQRLWSVIRMAGSGTFTTREIAMVINWPIKFPEEAARKYLRHLKDAGYVVELPKRECSRQPGSHGLKRYRLINNTGQFAPEFKASLSVMHDPNTKKDTPCAKLA